MGVLSEATVALGGVRGGAGAGGAILSSEFLAACGRVLPVVSGLGAGLAIVKSDIGGNIGRLVERHAQDEAKYEQLFGIVLAEVEAGTAKRTDSATNALLWLRRAMAFIVAIVAGLAADEALGCAEVAQRAYGETLKRYHGWVVQQGVQVALRFAPRREAFVEALGGDGAAEMRAFAETAAPLLEEIRQFLDGKGLDDATV
jgi:hypothetical protein